MANLAWNSFKKKLLDGTNINLASDTIKVALFPSSFTPNIDTQAVFSDISASEVTGTGYTAGGATLASQAVTQDNTNDRAMFDAADTSWASSTITARYAVIYKSTGTGSTSPLIGYITFLDGSSNPADKTTNGDTFYIQWAATGILLLS